MTPAAGWRRDAAEWLAYLPLALLVLAVVRWRVEGDTTHLVKSAADVLACLGELQLPCRRPVIHFPVFQFLFVVPMAAIGMDEATIATAMAAISSGFALAAAGLVFSIGRSVAGLAGGHLGLALLASGYAIYYARSSFNEMAGFTLFAAMGAAIVLRRAPWMAFATALLFSITKDVAAPFVLAGALAACVAADRGGEWRWQWRRWAIGVLPALAGALAGAMVNAGFNWFRYGELVNAGLLATNFKAPAGASTAYFAYLFLSPAGGLLYAWLTLALLIPFMLWLVRKRDVDLVVALAAAGVLVAANLGLSFWWSPFGWYAWGPRLTLPFLGIVVVLLLWVAGADVVRALRSVPIAAALPVVAVAIAISMLPNVFIIVAETEYWPRMFGPGMMERVMKMRELRLNEVGAEVIMIQSLEVYGRAVIAPTTLLVAKARPWVAGLVAAYALLASWRILRAPTAR